jgi:hypothetical protein
MEFAKILAMTHKRATVNEIADAVKRTIGFVINVCETGGITPTLVKPKRDPEPEPVTIDPLAAYRQQTNEARIDYADRILRTDERITTSRGIRYLDHKPITLLDTMIEANRRLNQLNLPQITGDPAWLA